MPTWLLPGVAIIVLVGFIVFGFRQGMKVKPDDRHDSGPSVGGGPDH